jgi:pimeloyl-ACP methyl ester carboxylesterase
MYDFEGKADEPGARLSRPPLLLTALEAVRLAVELPASVVVDAVVPRRDVGAGRPVLVLPGFYATDGLTGRVRSHLRRQGYRAYSWGLERNLGLTDRIVDGLPRRLQEVHERHHHPVSVVGWSFGGLLARWLAHEHPDAVRQVVTLGSPWRAEGEVTRATAMFEASARKNGISDRAREIVATLREPLPVPTTAIWSRTDGVVSWRACAVDEGPGSDNIEVVSSHVGLVSNPLALAALDDRLAQADPRDPEPFEWGRALRRYALGGSPTPAGAPA